jgi:hypothetical protein
MDTHASLVNIAHWGRSGARRWARCTVVGVYAGEGACAEAQRVRPGDEEGEEQRAVRQSPHTLGHGCSAQCECVDRYVKVMRPVYARYAP